MTRPSPHEGLSDEELARVFQADPRGPSGRAAVEALLGRYHTRVYRWCAWRIRDPERALELAQEAMFAALESLPRFDGRSRFSSWLYAITRNRCVSAVRSEHAKHWRRDTEVDPEELPVEDDPHARLKAREGEDRLLELMRTELEPLEQDALWLRVIEERTVPEITELLNIGSASGARGVLQNARRKLRAALARERRPSS